ncbi:MAG: excinuclease ABC subunit UvrA, partial [Kiritimatiellae bacterium]|nr:excinuclease ABC subunit UvrA [Kiritimatiellia bacterium]
MDDATHGAAGWIEIRGARTHNLQDVSLRFPRGEMTVVTGVSGSGKTSLAFDTVFAEGLRRYLDSLPNHARQFLDRMERPDVDFVGGLAPAISIGRSASAPGPRSTLATLADLHDFLRLLFAHLGVAHCPRCGRAIRAVAPGALAEELLREPEGTRITILSPMLRPGGG